MLLSKVQYKNYETGEFTDIRERSVSEIINLVNNYPWLQQCHLVAVSLTAPSVSIERGDNAILKISHYYHDKFSIYLLNSDGKSLKTHVEHLEDCTAVITQFCENTLDETTFETNHVYHAERHFITAQFIYRVKTGSFTASLALFSILPVAATFLTALVLSAGFQEGKKPAMIFAMVLSAVTSSALAFMVIKGWMIYFNHLNYAKDQFLELSKGKDEFTFGTNNVNKTYNKQDIDHINIYRTKSSKQIWSRLNITEIVFKNGEQIKISGLIIEYAYSKIPDAHCLFIDKLFTNIN